MRKLMIELGTSEEFYFTSFWNTLVKFTINDELICCYKKQTVFIYEYRTKQLIIPNSDSWYELYSSQKFSISTKLFRKILFNNFDLEIKSLRYLRYTRK